VVRPGRNWALELTPDMETNPGPETTRPGAEAPTVGQSVLVELAFGVVGIVLILILGRSFGDAYGAPLGRPFAAAAGLLAGIGLGGSFGYGVTRRTFRERARPFMARLTSSEPTLVNFALISRPHLERSRSSAPRSSRAPASWWRHCCS
jgi:hypothetical protein